MTRSLYVHVPFCERKCAYCDFASWADRGHEEPAWLVRIERVVIEHGLEAPAHADVVAALLTNDEVTIVNEVATIRGAYNRPAPPTAIDVWSFNGSQLRLGETVLSASSNESLAFGERTDFE